MTDVKIMSFGHRYGIPTDENLTLIDLRHILRNPHADRRLRKLTGQNKDVQKAVLRKSRAQFMLADLENAVLSGATTGVAFGCLAGRHRSVAMAEELARRLRAKKIDVELIHREQDRW